MEAHPKTRKEVLAGAQRSEEVPCRNRTGSEPKHLPPALQLCPCLGNPPEPKPCSREPAAPRSFLGRLPQGPTFQKTASPAARGRERWQPGGDCGGDHGAPGFGGG